MRFLQFSILANQAKIASSSRLPLQCSVREFSQKAVLDNEGGREHYDKDVPKLLRLPRCALEPSMYFSQVSNPRMYKNKSFRLVLRPLNAKQLQRINDGPNYLSGNYPMGLLKPKHEKRRYLDPNAKPLTGWRDFSDEDNNLENDNANEDTQYTSYRQSALIKRPLLVNSSVAKTSIESTPLHTYIPVLVITGKKAIDNRAVVRNRAKTRLLHAFQEVIKQKSANIKWPLTDQFGDPLAMVFYPSKEIIKEPMQDLINTCMETVQSISMRYKRDPGFSNNHANCSERKPANMNRKNAGMISKGNKRDTGSTHRPATRNVTRKVAGQE